MPLGRGVYGASENGQSLLQFLVGDDEGDESADAVAVLASAEEQEPVLKGGFDHLRGPLLVGGAPSASLTNSIAAIGPLPRTSPTKSGCRSWISRIEAMTRSPTMLARARRSSSSKASSTARAAAQAIGLPP